RLATVLLAAAVPVAVPVAARAAPQQCNLPATQVIGAEPWAQKRLAFQRVWPLTRGAGVTVGVVDTGVDARHPMLTGQVGTGLDITTQVGDAEPDCAGHGRMVAGIVAAHPVDGLGFVGVAPQARILPIRQANGSGDGDVGTLAASIVAAVDGGARVLNVSVT